MTVAGVIFATDLGDGRPSPVSLLGGVPMIARAVCALRDGAEVAQLVVLLDSTAAGGVVEIQQALDRALPGHGARLVAGLHGRHRSLHRALSIVESHIETVLLHEAGRPLAPAELASRVLDAVRGGAPAAVPVVEVTETVKELDAAGRVTSTVPRESLWRLQMPQAVRRPVLDAAHAGCPAADQILGTDDALALTPPGTAVRTVPGDHLAFPVVDSADLALAEAVLAVE
jgi:2-C-methyl-D-erythritol 4-phosphate cytidylyltransferase